MRSPVAEKIALQRAGRTGGRAGSPRPVGELSVFRKWTSISAGTWFMRTGGDFSKFFWTARAEAVGVLLGMTGVSPLLTPPRTWFLALFGVVIWVPTAPRDPVLFYLVLFS